MIKMTLGSYTFWRNPTQFTIPRKIRSVAVVQTYEAAAFFTWGLFTSGQRCILEWKAVTSSMWDSLQTLLEADDQIIWDPQTGATYNIQIMRLDGEYWESALTDAEYRRDIQLELLIRSQV